MRDGEGEVPQYTLIENSENVGFSVANNQAIKFMKGEYVLLLNPDTVFKRIHSQNIEYCDANPRLGGLGIPMFDGAEDTFLKVKRCATLGFVLQDFGHLQAVS